MPPSMNDAHDARRPEQIADTELTAKIKAIHTESHGTYGSPRVHQALTSRASRCGRAPRAAPHAPGGPGGPVQEALPHHHDPRPRVRGGTRPDPTRLRDRGELNRRYVGDITYISTWEGWAYLATVIDLSSRRVVGWALAAHMRTELVADALKMAVPPVDPRQASSFIRTAAVNTRHGTSASSPGATASCCRSDARASAGTTPWPRASSRRSSAS